MTVAVNVNVAAVALLAAAALLPLPCAGRAEDFPWVVRVESRPELNRALLSRLGSCAENATLVGKQTFGEFLQITSSKSRYGKADQPVLWSEIIYLTGKNHLRHPPLWRCPIAVHRALQMMLASTYERAGGSFADTTQWQLAFSDAGQLEAALGALTCRTCPVSEQPVLHAKLLEMYQQYTEDDWIHVWLREKIKTITDMEDRVQQGYNALTSLNEPVTDEVHFKIFKAGAAMMESLRQAGVIHFWSLSRGSMIYALRYGRTRGEVLPSGYRDPSHWDMDISVSLRVETWELFLSHVNNLAEKEGWWCGFQAGWPANCAFCVRSGAELDLCQMEGEMVTAATPLTRCLIQAPDPLEEQLELPCPSEPRLFLKEVWTRQFKASAGTWDCLPFPRSYTGVDGSITSADAEELFNISLRLRAAGFSSMVPYYADCQNHEFASLAQSLARTDEPELELELEREL